MSGHEMVLHVAAWQDGAVNPSVTATALRQDIQRSGYYPDLVAEALDTVLGGEDPTNFVVQHEATFDRDELRRHITVLVLTGTRLIVCHVDEHAPDGAPTPLASASTEAVRLNRVDSVVVTRVVTDPASHQPGGPTAEVVLTIGWGAVSRIDLEPAACQDPSCEADHGYTGTSTNDDLSVRVSEAADGAQTVARLLDFAAALSSALATTDPDRQ
jgi:hypothetical protein